MEQGLKAFLVVFISVFGLIAAIFIAVLWDYIYYPIIGFKAEHAAVVYMKSEDFLIESVAYSKQFGEDKGKYLVTAHPATRPQLKFYVSVSQDFKVDEHSFKESKWRYDTIKEYAPLISQLSPGFDCYAVNINIPKELLDKFSAETQYKDIRKLHEHATEEYLFMGMAVDPYFTEQRALEYGYLVTEFMKQRALKDASMEIIFYPKSFIESLGNDIRKNDVFTMQSDTMNSKFYREALPFKIQFDTRTGKTKTTLDLIKSPEDMKPFLTKK
ncbi:hypothetical protein GON05_10205 [Paenibacillus sp. MAH-34]|uniref:Uncharacterized protein n=1 Tax=Paenibacillus anseongense TaxID=2682845 RepID=A0ABW9U4L5_9BACL|nr:hypothetical protein [Paenibacillus anseongense]MVQ35027.1 hypothetical protein [Paenibacillus anseongense]